MGRKALTASLLPGTGAFLYSEGGFCVLEMIARGLGRCDQSVESFDQSELGCGLKVLAGPTLFWMVYLNFTDGC